MAKVKIGQASSGEPGHTVRGGQAGDQTGKETNIKNWYAKGSKGPWRELLRCKDETIAKSAAGIMVKLINSNLVGYDQDNRITLYNALKKYDWNVEKYIKSGEKTETDCSAFVYTCYCCLIPELRQWCEKHGNPAATSNLSQVFLECGNKFTLFTDPKVVTSTDYLKVGDILNVPYAHALMVVATDGSALIIDSPTNNTVNFSQTSLKPSTSTSSVPVSTSTSKSNVVSNQVTNLSNASRYYQSQTSQVGDNRKDSFEAMRKKLIHDSGENQIDNNLMTTELYDVNILKGVQEARKVIVKKTS